MAQETNTNMIIDSPSIDNPVYIHDITSLTSGEADYCIWHYTIHCRGTECLVVACDTDVCLYGLGLWEAGS